MAMHSISILNPPPLLPMVDGVEFYVTECENVMPPEATPFDSPKESFRACTVLVSFARSDAERAALQPLRHALTFGQTSSEVCGGSDWLQKLPKRLLARLEAPKHDLVTIVVCAGSDGDLDAETVQAAADSLRQCFGDSLAALLVVADISSHRFDSVQRVSGFVVGASGTNAETARSVFLCLSMLLAPKTFTGMDLVDLLPIFDGARKPTVLATALWLRDGDGRLVFASDSDIQAVRCAPHVVAFPFFAGPSGWTELHRVCKAIRDEVDESARMIYFAGDGAISPGTLSSRVCIVPILCGNAKEVGIRVGL